MRSAIAAFAVAVGLTFASNASQAQVRYTIPTEMQASQPAYEVETVTYTKRWHRGRRTTEYGDATIIGGRPPGCPHAYCGCGLAHYLGLSDKRLNLAWNWQRFFQREHRPRVGLVAVWRHHVAYIVGGSDGQWVLRDYNSGRGLSRIHSRPVRGAVFVNPGVRLTQN